MTPLSVPSVSDHLSLEEAVARLKRSPRMDGLAEFGSRTLNQSGAASDYDLLVLVDALPAPVFQMVTTIGGRLADVVLVETETADALLLAGEPPEPRSFEGLFARKMQTAHILHDVSGRLHGIRQLVTGAGWDAKSASALVASDLYAAWFWQSFGLLHLERLAGSQEPIHLTAFDMMLTACLSGAWRSYFEIRGIPWEGEKAALRYWAQEDAGYLAVLRRCLAAAGRDERLGAFRELVALTLAPAGAPFTKGTTAAILADPAAGVAELESTLLYWNALFGS